MHAREMAAFNVINLAVLKIGLENLLTTRHAALVLTEVGSGHAGMLTRQKSAIDALPAALTSGRPMADALSDTDAGYDGFGSGIYWHTESYLRIPTLSEALRAAINRIRTTLIPSLAILQESYADEASAAADSKNELPTIEADLKLFPLAGGGTLYDWATSFLGAGETLSVLLSQRADIDAKTRKNAAKLRSEAIGMLNDLRTAAFREARQRPELPADIDAQIFAYFDTLEEQRKAANAAKAKAEPAPEPAAPTEPSKGEGDAPKPS